LFFFCAAACGSSNFWMPTCQHCNQHPVTSPHWCCMALLPQRWRLNVSSFFLLQRRRVVDCFILLLKVWKAAHKKWMATLAMCHVELAATPPTTAPQQHCHCHQQRRFNVSFFLLIWHGSATTTETPPNAAIVFLAPPPPPSHSSSIMCGTKNTTTTHWHQCHRSIVF